MTDVLSGTLEEIANQVNDLNIEVSILLAYDYQNETWRVVAVDENGQIKTA